MKKPKHIAQNIIIGLDFDGVLGQGLPVKIKYAKKWFGVNLSLDQTKEPSFNELMKSRGRPEINYRTLMDPVNEKHIMEYQVPPDCKSVLSQLFKQGFRFAVITSRNNHDYPYAKLFIKEHFQGLIKYVHNTRNEPKGKFVRRLRPRVLLDDGLKKLVQIKDYPIELVYYRQPENNHENVSLTHKSRIIEVSGWRQFYDYMQLLKMIHEAICWENKWHNSYFNIAKIYAQYKSLNNVELQNLLQRYKQNV